jgi:hypothetical protein
MMKRFKKWLALKMLPFVTRNSPDSMTAYIHERAGETALQVVLDYLDREGLTHCYVCPNRRGPLRKVGPYMACPKHVDTVQKLVAEKEAQPVPAAPLVKAAA